MVDSVLHQIVVPFVHVNIFDLTRNSLDIWVLLILTDFIWPALKEDLAEYYCTCHVCHSAGKPDQYLNSSHPSPATGAFAHALFDFVGPLLKTQSGHQCLLTLMCTAN